MAFSQSLNGTPATGAFAMWQLISTLIAAGWTKQADSDGTTYSSSGVQVTGGGTGTNGLGNNSAWVRLRSPAGAGGREITIQRGTANTSWRIQYSRAAGFSGGTPGATRVPTATDGQTLWGGGTDASPTYTALFGTDNTYRLQTRADQAAPYGFFLVCYASGSDPNAAFIMDPLQSGTYPNEDVDPMMIHVDTALTGTGSLTDESSCPRGFLKAGLAGEGFVRIPALIPCSYASSALQQCGPDQLGSNPHNSADDALPILYARRAALAAPVGYKGVSSLMRWVGANRATADSLGSKSRVVAGQVSLPNDGATDWIV